MPFANGPEPWDQNIKTLGGALFPDPSKVAHAYYYGSEARKAQIEAAKMQDQMAAGHAGLGMQFGLRPNPTYRQDDFNNTIMNDPYAVPTAPGPTAPPAPPGAPVSPTQALPTLGATVAQTPPDALAKGIVAGVENNAASATLPPVAPATAVSGPEPTTTTSNGMTPQNAPRTVQPGSVTSAGGGGRIYAPPGAADGTPSPSMFNFGQQVALLVASGMPVQAAQAQATATLASMVKNGQMAVPLAEQMAAFMGAPTMRNQTIANEGALATTKVTAGAHLAAQRMVTEESRRASEEAPEPVYDANGRVIYQRRRDIYGQPAATSTLQGQTGAIGTYVSPDRPNEPARTMTAGTAVAGGMQPAAGTQAEQLTQRILNTPPGPEQDRLVQQARLLASTPKELDPKAQQAQQAVDYRGVQQIYAVPQKSVYGTLSVKEPSAFDAVAENEVRRRTSELTLRPENRHLDPSGLRGAAINDLMQNPSKVNGLRLPTPAEVVQQRIPVKSRYTSAGFKGDDRLDTYPSPYDKPGEGSDHMMIRMVPKDYKPGGEPGKGAAATGAAPAATAAAPTVNYVDPSGMGMGGAMPTGAAPTAAAPPAAPVASAAAAPAAPYTPPGPGLIEKVSSLWRGNTPPYVSPRPGQAAAPQAAPAVPGPAPTVSGGAPPGALGPARPGVPDGPATTADGRIVNVRGGWVFP